MAMKLLQTNDGSGITNSAFTSGIDGTYKLYIVKWYDVNPADEAGNVQFVFNGSIDGGSNYNVAKTTTNFHWYHYEDDTTGGIVDFAYNTDGDEAQGTGYQNLTQEQGDGGDESSAGTLWLFNPSNTTYVKHFYSTADGYAAGNRPFAVSASGYFNTTSAINAIDFRVQEEGVTSESFDAVIKLYGVS